MAVFRDIDTSVRINGELTLPQGSITVGTNRITLNHSNGNILTMGNLTVAGSISGSAITGTSFSGNGSGLTNLSSANMAGVLLLDGTRVMTGNLNFNGNHITNIHEVRGRGAANRINIYQNTGTANSHSWIEMWGSDASRGGELSLAGTYVTFRTGSTDTLAGTEVMRLSGTTLTLAGGAISTGTVNASINLQENGTNLSSKYVLQTINVSAGTGLSGGGTLAANRTISVDFGTGTNQVPRGDHNHDNRYVNLTGDIMTGNLIIGTGIATAQRQLHLTNSGGDAVGIRFERTTSGQHKWELVNEGGVFTIRHSPDNGVYTETIHLNTARQVGIGMVPAHPLDVTGVIRGSSNVILGAQATGTTHAVRADRNISVGNGLTGGGNLTADRTITLGTPSVLSGTTANAVTADSHTHSILSTDSRTDSSTANLLQAKTMNDHRTSTDHHVLSITDTRGAMRAPNFYERRAVRWDFTESTSSGAGGDSWNVLMTVSPWNSYNDVHRQQQIAFTGTGGLKFRWATSDTAWAAWQDIVLSNRSVSTGTGLNGGGNLTADRTLSVDFGTGNTQVARGDHNHDTFYVRLNTINQTVGTGFGVNGKLNINRLNASTGGDLEVFNRDNTGTIRLDSDGLVAGNLHTSSRIVLAGGDGSARFNGAVRVNTLAINVANGTVPMTITSQTMVSNLNVEMLDGVRREAFDRRESNTDVGGWGVQHGVRARQVSPAPTNAMAVDAGIVYLQDGTRVIFVGNETIVIPNGHASSPRIDVIFVAGSGANKGTLQRQAGTPAATPAVPAIPSDAVRIAHITVHANASTITDGSTGGQLNMISDQRAWKDVRLVNDIFEVTRDIREKGTLLEAKYARLASANTFTQNQTINGRMHIQTSGNMNLAPTSTNYYLRVSDGTNHVAFDPDEILATGALNVQATNGALNLRSNGTNGLIEMHQKVKASNSAITVTIPRNQRSVTWTHNYGSTSYAVNLTPNSFERHVRWTNKTSNVITVEIDMVSDQDILVDCILIGY